MTVLSPHFKTRLSCLALAASMALSLASAALALGGAPDPGFDMTLGNIALLEAR